MTTDHQRRYNLAANAVNDLQTWIDHKYPTNVNRPMIVLTTGNNGVYLDISVNCIMGVLSLWNSECDTPETMCLNSIRLIYKAQIGHLARVLDSNTKES